MEENENLDMPTNEDDNLEKIMSDDLEELTEEITKDNESDFDDFKTKQALALEAVFDVPVKVTAVLGRTKMEVNQLLKLMKGNVIALDKKIGETVDIYVNDRLIAKGEVVVVNDKLGVTMTEIIKVE